MGHFFFLILGDTEEISKLTGENNKLPVLESAVAIAISFAICKMGSSITSYFSIQGGNLPCVTAIAVALATIFPSYFTKLAPTGEAMALILMQVVQIYLCTILFRPLQMIGHASDLMFFRKS